MPFVTVAHADYQDSGRIHGGVRMIFRREPVVFQTLVFAILNGLIAFELVDLSAAQIGAINALVAAILGFIVRTVVTPLADPRNNDGKALVAKP
jgi:hypothetical protein